MISYIRYGLCIIFICITILLMCFMWGFSNENAGNSSSLSLKVCDFAIDVVNTVFYNSKMDIDSKVEIIEWIHNPIRKCAHMFEYFVLFLSMNLSISSIYIILIKSEEKMIHLFFTLHKRVIFYVITCCIMYSCIDEIHQYFIEGRACRITDVLIDTIGMIIGLISICVSNRLIHNTKKTNINNSFLSLNK